MPTTCTASFNISYPLIQPEAQEKVDRVACLCNGKMFDLRSGLWFDSRSEQYQAVTTRNMDGWVTGLVNHLGI